MSAPRAAARLLAVGVALAAGWLLAPGLSAQPYLPGARDFEQALPAIERVTEPTRAPAHHGHPGEGAVTYRSDVVVAPARFDAAGIAHELRPLELRARETGGDWGEWIEIANGDPAWFGGAEELQVRARGWRPAGTLHYVNVSGDSTPAEGLLTDAREAVNGAVVSASGLLSADVAAAELPKPEIVSRRAWGANGGGGGCEPRERPEYGRVKAALVHHTVGTNTYSEGQAPSVVLAICRYHRNALGWNDIGYNALVDRFGNIYAGRAGGLGSAVVGAHAQGVNTQTSGVAAMGTHTSKPIGKAGMSGLAHWLAWKLVQHGKTAKGRPKLVSAGGGGSRHSSGEAFRMQRIAGHSRTHFTECPGKGLNGQLRKLRRKVQTRITDGGGTKPPDGGGIGG